MKKILIGFMAVFVVTGAVAVQWWNHNRMGLLCVMTVVWPDSPGYSKLVEKASVGNGPFHLKAQRDLLYDFSNAEWGICLPHDDDKFYEFLEKTAKDGWAESEYAYSFVIGKVYGDSNKAAVSFTERLDAKESFAYLKNAADKGARGAAKDLSHAYLAGKWGDVHLTCDNFAKRGASADHKFDKVKLCSRSEEFLYGEWGDNYFDVGVDYAKSMEWLTIAAERGDNDAVYEIGKRYRYGVYGAEKDYLQAFELFSRAAAENVNVNSEARAELAWMYAEGVGVKKDFEQALFWIDQSVKNIKPSEIGSVNHKILEESQSRMMTLQREQTKE